MKRTCLSIYSTALFSYAFCLQADAFAQSLPAAPLRNNAQEQTADDTEAFLEDLQAAQEAKQQSQALDKDQAAEALTSNDEQTEERNADDETELSTGILGKLPSDENLQKLADKITAQPNNLDHYFAYAQMAQTLGEYAKEAQMYERMLTLAPALDRVRLDLGAAYLRLGRFADAKRELEAVLKRNLPDTVRPNVEKVLAQVNEELKEHDFGGSFTVGFNYDTNGNSAPRSKSVLVEALQAAPLPLDGDGLEQHDIQAFSALSLNHTYRPLWAQDEAISHRWKTSANYYRSKQSSLESLNVQVYGLKTGPEWRFNESGLTIHPSISRNQIILAEQTYLRTTSADLNISYPLSKRLLLNASHSSQWRDFQNSDSVQTYADRTGTATEFTLGASYLATAEDILNTRVTHRRERTRQEFYDNEQLGITFGYTRILPYDSFASANLGYKNTVYDGNDPLISSRTRHDKERSATLTLGHKLAEELTATLGYQYRKTGSNILNYAYDNHRISATLSYGF